MRDCFKIDGDAHILSAANMQPTVCGFWRYKSYADVRRGSLMRWCQMSVRSSKTRVFSFDRYMHRPIFRMTFPIGITYRNLHDFARFPNDSTAFFSLLVYIVCNLCLTDVFKSALCLRVECRWRELWLLLKARSKLSTISHTHDAGTKKLPSNCIQRMLLRLNPNKRYRIGLSCYRCIFVFLLAYLTCTCFLASLRV